MMMRRREFIAGLGGAAAWPVVARAQQRAMPVIGYLGSQSADEYKNFTVPFLQGLKETGYVEGQNVAVEYRWAESQDDRLPALAADLVRRRVVYSQSVFARDGGLLSYGADREDPWRRAASYVDRILRGEKPGDLPVQFPSKFEMAVNLKTAKALSLTVPQSILLTADEVIE
jgi:ABC transporter substrate binding protein